MLNIFKDYLPARSEWADVWDILMAGLAFPLAVTALVALGFDSELASAGVLAKLPFGAVLVALIVKLFQEMAPEMPISSVSFHQVFWASCVVPLSMFWVLHFTNQTDALSPLLIFAGWVVLSPATLLPRLLNRITPIGRDTA